MIQALLVRFYPTNRFTEQHQGRPATVGFFGLGNLKHIRFSKLYGDEES